MLGWTGKNLDNFLTLDHSIIKIVSPQCPQRLGPGFSANTKLHGHSSSLYKIMKYLHLTYAHPLIYFKSFLNLL